MAKEKISFSISNLELKSLLDKFVKEVSDSNTLLERIPYPDWKALIRFTKKTEGLNIIFNFKQNTVRIEDNEAYFHAEIKDCSFGEFLFNHFLSDGGSQEMMTGNDYLNICLSSSADSAAKISDYNTTTSDWNTITDRTYYNPYLTITDTKADKEDLARVEAKIDNHIRKENEKMKGFNFDFGPMNGNVVRLSMYGLAVKNKTGTYVAYDAVNNTLMDVDILNFDGAQFLYKMPVAIKDIVAGDIVIHQGVPMFVQNVVNTNKSLVVVDPVNGERKEILPARSSFGFDFATKIVNFLGNMTATTASADNPFGNMWMLLAMSGNTKMEDMLPMALMAGGMDMSNPMMMWALMGNHTNDPMMLAMAMGAFNKPAAPTHIFTCGGNCGEHHD